jgi:hypothetical protein
LGALRRSLVRLVRLFVTRPATLVAALLVVVVVAAAVIVLPSLLPSVPGLSLAQSASEPRATQDYLKANQDYDASLMWASLDADAQQRLSAAGAGQSDLQQQMDAAKSHGFKLEQVSYVGGKSMPDGTSVQFYLVGIRQDPQSDLDYQPYMFTLDHDGKIAKVQ